MKIFIWQDQVTKEIFKKEYNLEFQKDAENDEEFLNWAYGRILKRIKETSNEL